jgi:hypothetical protein
MKTRYLLAVILTGFSAAASADQKFEGFLCCNMRTDGSWIMDINYAESHKTLLPAGTPVKVTGYGRYRARVEIDGKKQAIGNDYSRTLDNETFARRYVVAEDPRVKLAAYPADIRAAIESAKVKKGMNQEQVLMSVGYPVTSENPDLNAKVWRMWLSSFAEFQILWGDDGKVKDIVTDPQTRNLVVEE